MARFNGNHIENPAAYQDAIQRRIKANAFLTRTRNFNAAISGDSVEFQAWITGDTMRVPGIAALHAASSAEWAETSEEGEASKTYQRVNQNFWRIYGTTPNFLREAIDEWGGLTDGQLAWARKEFAARTTKAEERAAERKAKAANAQPWTAGRQTVEGTIKSARWDSIAVGYNNVSTSLKGMIELTDGRRLWTTIPAGYGLEPETAKGAFICIKVTVSVSEDDTTMGFGSRPTAVNNVISEARGDERFPEVR